MLSGTDKRFRNLDHRRAVSLLLATTAWRKMTLGVHLEGQSPEKGKAALDKGTAMYLVCPGVNASKFSFSVFFK